MRHRQKQLYRRHRILRQVAHVVETIAGWPGVISVRPGAIIPKGFSRTAEPCVKETQQFPYGINYTVYSSDGGQVVTVATNDPDRLRARIARAFKQR